MKHTQYCTIAYSLYCNCYQPKPDKCEWCEAIPCLCGDKLDGYGCE